VPAFVAWNGQALPMIGASPELHQWLTLLDFPAAVWPTRPRTAPFPGAVHSDPQYPQNPYPLPTHPPEVRLNSLWWPSGLGRWSVGYFAIPPQDDQEQSQSPIKQAEASREIGVLTMGDGIQAVEYSPMVIVRRIGLTGSATRGGGFQHGPLQIACVTDVRYFWNQIPIPTHRLAYGMDWEQFFTALLMPLLRDEEFAKDWAQYFVRKSNAGHRTKIRPDITYYKTATLSVGQALDLAAATIGVSLLLMPQAVIDKEPQDAFKGEKIEYSIVAADYDDTQRLENLPLLWSAGIGFSNEGGQYPDEQIPVRVLFPYSHGGALHGDGRYWATDWQNLPQDDEEPTEDEDDQEEQQSQSGNPQQEELRQPAIEQSDDPLFPIAVWCTYPALRERPLPQLGVRDPDNRDDLLQVAEHIQEIYKHRARQCAWGALVYSGVPFNQGIDWRRFPQQRGFFPNALSHTGSEESFWLLLGVPGPTVAHGTAGGLRCQSLVRALPAPYVPTIWPIIPAETQEQSQNPDNQSQSGPGNGDDQSSTRPVHRVRPSEIVAAQLLEGWKFERSKKRTAYTMARLVYDEKGDGKYVPMGKDKVRVYDPMDLRHGTKPKDIVWVAVLPPDTSRLVLVSRHADTLIVRTTNPIPNDDGYYEGIIQFWNARKKRWEDGPSCYVLDANDPGR